MDFFERDLEDIIFNALQTEEGRDVLNEKGLNVDFEVGLLRTARQLRIGNYGMCDIITMSRGNTEIDEQWGMTQPNLYINVYELKRGKIDADALIQVKRYMTGVEHYMKLFHPKLGVYVRGTIIGRSICTNDWVYLVGDLDRIEFYSYSYSIDGIDFKEHNGPYTLTQHGLIKSNSKQPF
jgi:hypothetical protein